MTSYQTLASSGNVTFADPAFTTAEQAGVAIGLDKDSAERLLRFSTLHIGQPMAVIVDKRVLVSATITEPFSEEVQLHGIGADVAEMLIALLRSGPLPTLLSVVSVEAFAVGIAQS